MPIDYHNHKSINDHKITTFYTCSFHIKFKIGMRSDIFILPNEVTTLQLKSPLQNSGISQSIKLVDDVWNIHPLISF